MSDDRKKPTSFGEVIVRILVVGVLIFVVRGCDSSGRELEQKLSAMKQAGPETFEVSLQALVTVATQTPGRLVWETGMFEANPKVTPTQKLSELIGSAHVDGEQPAQAAQRIGLLMAEYKKLPKIVVKPTFWESVCTEALDDD